MVAENVLILAIALGLEIRLHGLLPRRFHGVRSLPAVVAQVNDPGTVVGNAFVHEVEQSRRMVLPLGPGAAQKRNAQITQDASIHGSPGEHARPALVSLEDPSVAWLRPSRRLVPHALDGFEVVHDLRLLRGNQVGELVHAFELHGDFGLDEIEDVGDDVRVHALVQAAERSSREN